MRIHFLVGKIQDQLFKIRTVSLSGMLAHVDMIIFNDTQHLCRRIIDDCQSVGWPELFQKNVTVTSDLVISDLLPVYNHNPAADCNVQSEICQVLHGTNSCKLYVNSEKSSGPAWRQFSVIAMG
jgi:hypothetical protein